MKRQQYLDEICSHIRFLEIRPQVRQELEAHFDDIADECRAQGMDETEAFDEAIRRMGDAPSLGRELDRTHRPGLEWSLLLLTSLLIGFGLAVLYSIESAGMLRSAVPVFSRTLAFLPVGLLLLSGLTWCDYHRYQGYARPFFWAVLFLSFFLLHFGTLVRGKPFWCIGPLSIDFVSITPFLFMVAVAGIFSQSGWSWSRRGFWRGVFLLVLPVLFYLGANSIPSIILYTGTFLALALVSGARWKQVLSMAMVIVLPMIAGLFTQPYRMERLMSYLNPGANPDGTGYIYLQLQNALRETGLLGHGAIFPAGIPEFHTDLVFVYLIYTFGWMAGILLAGLAFLLIVRLFRAAGKIKDGFGHLLSVGAAMMFLIQFTWNILMTIGIVPIFSISMPFISYGGSMFLSQMLLLGLVMSAYRRRNLERNPAPPPTL